METLLTRSRIEEFEKAARERRADRLEREKIEEMRRHQRKQEIEHRIDDEQRNREEWSEIVEAAFASTERIKAFQVQLDSYDTHTVEALMANQEALEAVRHRIERMMNEAHVLPDGRRVFRTEDGQRVFDEHGQAVSPEVIDPNHIDRRKPTWEQMRATLEEQAHLQKERQELLDYQRKLDEARERLDHGDITNRDLKDMEDRLKTQMPDAVRQRVGENGHDLAPIQGREAPAASAAPVAAAATPLPANMDDLMRQTGLGPAAPRVG